MGLLKDLNVVRQQSKLVKRPTLRDAYESRKDPTKAFQAAPDYEHAKDAPRTRARATVVASRVTGLFWGDRTLVALSLVVVPEGGPAYVAAVESGVPDEWLPRCTAGLVVPVTAHQDDRMLLSVEWSG
jgi:hypothetical protein